MKYSTTIIGWGEEALSFLEDPEDPFIIIFNKNAPEELAEIAVLHEIAPLLADPVAGDVMAVCGKIYDVTAVGEEALHTLRELGHCSLKFTGKDEPDLPGCIMLKGDDPLTVADIAVGKKIEIF